VQGRRGLGQRPERWITVAAAAVGAAFGAYLVRGGRSDVAPAHSLREVLTRVEHDGFPPGLLISLAIWILVSVYWEVSARKAGDRVRSEATASRLVHVFLVGLAQILLFAPIPGLRVRFLPETLGLVILGLAIQLASALLAVWARRRLGRNWSGAIATVADQQLVRSGPYRVVRHPVYTGLLGLYLGTALVSGELHALLGLILVLIAYWRKIRMEESHLRELFGRAYEEYRTTTWALVPGVL
jgi:protein-S-isoprenylcysteine O-methyltransferase Ste14